MSSRGTAVSPSAHSLLKRKSAGSPDLPRANTPRSSPFATVHSSSSSNPAMTGPRRARVPSRGADGASPHTPLRSPGSKPKPRKTVPDWGSRHNSICEKPGCGVGGNMFECRCCNVVYHLKCVSAHDRKFLSRDYVDNLWECPVCWCETLSNDGDHVKFPTIR